VLNSTAWEIYKIQIEWREKGLFYTVRQNLINGGRGSTADCCSKNQESFQSAVKLKALGIELKKEGGPRNSCDLK